MNIDELEAGRELNALVAEKVMGWTDLHWVDGGYDGKGNYSPTGYYGKGPDRAVFLTSKFSTDIAAAWKVVEKIACSGLIVRVTWDFNPLASCSIHKDDHLWTMIAECICDTAPLAICRAALKAVGDLG